MPGANIFGVVGSSVDAPRVGYLEEPLAASPEILGLSRPVRPTEVFRLAAPCVEHRCSHFDGHDCRLVSRIVKFLDPVSEPLPACQVRKDCRWFRQEGRAACERCPQVITQNCNPGDAMVRAATPA
jgi:hypothetical protein